MINFISDYNWSILYWHMIYNNLWTEQNKTKSNMGLIQKQHICFLWRPSIKLADIRETVWKHKVRRLELYQCIRLPWKKKFLWHMMRSFATHLVRWPNKHKSTNKKQRIKWVCRIFFNLLALLRHKKKEKYYFSIVPFSIWGYIFIKIQHQ